MAKQDGGGAERMLGRKGQSQRRYHEMQSEQDGKRHKRAIEMGYFKL